MNHVSRVLLFSLSLPLSVACGQLTPTRESPEATCAITFANFAPLNTDVFVANADGGDSKPLLADAVLDYNASFSADVHWIVLASERNGLADIHRVHPDGSGSQRITDDAAFDDQWLLTDSTENAGSRTGLQMRGISSIDAQETVVTF